jgi:DNA polymerase IIIc chi subunit
VRKAAADLWHEDLWQFLEDNNIPNGILLEEENKLEGLVLEKAKKKEEMEKRNLAISFYKSLASRAREAILEDRFLEFKKQFLDGYKKN